MREDPQRIAHLRFRSSENEGHKFQTSSVLVLSPGSVGLLSRLLMLIMERHDHLHTEGIAASLKERTYGYFPGRVIST